MSKCSATNLKFSIRLLRLRSILDDENLSETTRLTYRVLDLRRPVMQKNLRTRYRTAMAFRKFLDANGFIDVETPALTRSTPEGARDYLVPSRVQEGASLLAAVTAALQAVAEVVGSTVITRSSSVSATKIFVPTVSRNSLRWILKPAS